MTSPEPRPPSNQRIDALIVDHLELVRAISKRQAKRLPRSIELDDIIQVGTCGLMRAAQSPRYDPARPFAPYASTFIRRFIITEFRRRNYSYELHGELSERTPDPAPSVEESAGRRKISEHVQEALASVPLQERQVLTDRAAGDTYAAAGARHNRSASWAFYKARCGEARLRRSLAMHKLDKP